MVVPARTFSAIVLNGTEPLSHAATVTAWPSSGSQSSETSVIDLRNGSRDFRIGVNSKSAPTFVGVQYPGLSPSGTNTAPNRLSGFAAVFAVGVNAGTIASKKGSAMAAPMPRRIVRRDIDIFVANIVVSFSDRKSEIM